MGIDNREPRDNHNREKEKVIRTLTDGMRDTIQAIEEYPTSDRKLLGGWASEEDQLHDLFYIIDGPLKPVIRLGRSKAGEQITSIRVRSMPDTKFGDGLVHFGTPVALLPDELREAIRGHEEFPDNPDFVLRVGIHADPATISQVDRADRHVLNAKYIIGEGQIGKLVQMPPEIEDDRPAVHSWYGTIKVVAVPLQGGDLELIAHAMSTVMSALKPQPTSGKGA
jgi:hypothetical protein